MYWDKDNGCISYISDFLGNEPKRNEIHDLHIESLFHEVWCKAEWASRCLIKDTFGASSVQDVFGKKICNQIKEAI